MLTVILVYTGLFLLYTAYVLDDVVVYLQDYPHYNPNLDYVVFYLQDYPHYKPNLDYVVFYLQDYPHYNPNLDDVVFYLQDYPHYNPNQEAQLRQLAENHGRQMEYLQIKNKDLEKQREGIY